MSEQDQKTSPEQSGAAANRPEKPLHFHEHLLSQFMTSVQERGEAAYENWGIAMYHSLSDEDCEAQREMLGMDPSDALDFYNRACLMAQREEYAAAAKAFEKALELDGAMSEALYNQALALEKSGDVAGARKLWDRYIKSTDDSDETREIQQHLTELA